MAQTAFRFKYNLTKMPLKFEYNRLFISKDGGKFYIYINQKVI